MSNANDNPDKVDLLKFFMEYYGRYHDHKETMAWVATALYLVGIMYLASHLRSGIDGGCAWKVGGSVAIAFAGFLALCFVYWQFKMRWTAHVRVHWIVEKLKRFERGERACLTVAPIFDCKPPKRCCGQYREACRCLLPWRWSEDLRFLEPLKSEVITYVAIILATAAALGLVGSAP